MPTTTETRVNDLIINKMSKAQFDALQEKSPTELYIVEGDSNVIYAEQAVALPVASADNLGKLYQYIGATDANYTQNYFYKCVSSGSPAVYSWQQVNVQPAVDPLPSQSGQSGKFLTTDGTDASWGDALVNTATGNNSLTIGGTAATGFMATNIGSGTQASSQGTALGTQSQATGTQSIAIGISASASQTRSIQIGNGANNDSNTVKISNANGNFEIMSADGTIPTDRLTNAINKYSTMPSPSSNTVGLIVQYTGTTNQNYTHGYLYEGVQEESSLSASQEPAILSTFSVDKTTFETQITTTGQYQFTYNTDTEKWYDENEQEVNLADYGITATFGLFKMNVVITIDYNAAGYYWRPSYTQLPIPSQAGQTGAALWTSGNGVEWNSKVLTNDTSGNINQILSIKGSTGGPLTSGVVIGYNSALNSSFDSIAIGGGIGNGASVTNSFHCIAIGTGAIDPTGIHMPHCAIQLGGDNTNPPVNNDSNTFKVANQNGNYEIMSADGTIPTDRFTTTPVAAGTYSASITIDGQGNVTRSWATAPDPLPSQTGQSGKFLTTDGTTASWATVDALPSQTGNAGKVLSTNGTTASWVDMTTTPATTPVLQGGSTYWIEDQQTHVISQTINVTGVTANNVVMVSPIPVNADEYAENGVICTTQAAGTLTFTCKTIPTNDLSVNVVCF